MFSAEGRTDMKNLTVAFRNFANAPNKIPTSILSAVFDPRFQESGDFKHTL